jgi:hypothetical protein
MPRPPDAPTAPTRSAPAADWHQAVDRSRVTWMSPRATPGAHPAVVPSRPVAETVAAGAVSQAHVVPSSHRGRPVWCSTEGPLSGERSGPGAVTDDRPCSFMTRPNRAPTRLVIQPEEPSRPGSTRRWSGWLLARTRDAGTSP